MSRRVVVFWVVAIGASLAAFARVTPSTPSLSAAAEAESTIQGIRDRGVRARPDLPPSQAAALSAGAETDSIMARQTPAEQQLEAADGFWGYLLVNTEGRATVCREVGVDISTFVAGVTAQAAPERRLADAIHTEAAVRADPSYPGIVAQMVAAARVSMQDAATARRTNVAGVCRFLNDSAAAVMPHFRLKTMAPAVYRVLYGEAPSPGR